MPSIAWYRSEANADKLLEQLRKAGIAAKVATTDHYWKVVVADSDVQKAYKILDEQIAKPHVAKPA